MSTPVLTVSSRTPSESYYRPDLFHKSLERFGVKPWVLGVGDWNGLMSKPWHFRAWLRNARLPDEERVLVTDCWDVIFTEHPDSVAARTESFGNAVVFNTEKSCWPLSEMAIHFMDKGSPWRYLNGGVFCGPAGLVLEMFEKMGLEEIGFDRVEDGKRVEPNDAIPLLMAFVNQTVPVVVDARCEVFQTFSACTLDEFEVGATGVKNRMTGTTPGVLHFNGDAKNHIMPAVAAALSL